MSETRPARAPRVKRRKSTTETLLSIVLILEATMLFFATLTVFGLKALPPVPAFVGGGALILLIVIASRLVRWTWGVWLGWVLQVAIVATGFLIPIMFLIGAGFAVLWVWCFLRARDIDRQRAAFEAEFVDPARDQPSNQPPSQPPSKTSTPDQGDRS